MPKQAARKRAERLGDAQRLRSSTLFTETYRQGKRFVGRHMVLWVRTGPGACLRVGVVSSRKIGCAVERNRARRRLRELFRRNRVGLRQDVDLVLVARRGAVYTPFEELKADWHTLTRRAKLWVTPTPKNPSKPME